MQCCFACVPYGSWTHQNMRQVCECMILPSILMWTKNVRHLYEYTQWWCRAGLYLALHPKQKAANWTQWCTPLVHFVEYGTGNCIMSRVNWKSTLLTDMFLLLLQISWSGNQALGPPDAAWITTRFVHSEVSACWSCWIREFQFAVVVWALAKVLQFGGSPCKYSLKRGKLASHISEIYCTIISQVRLLQVSFGCCMQKWISKHFVEG